MVIDWSKPDEARKVIVGDRCHSSLVCNERDVMTFENMGYQVEEKDKKTAEVSMSDGEANYGNYNELNALIGKGIPFYGYHGEGGEYGASVFACDGKTVAWAECNRNGDVMVTLDDSRQPEESSMNAANEYLDTLDEAKRCCMEHADVLSAIGAGPGMAGDYRRRKKKKETV